MSDPSISSNLVYHHAGGIAANRLTNADGLSYWQHAAHAEFRVVTNPSFAGSFSITGNPLNADVDSSSVAIYVDGALNQVVAFNVGGLLNKMQTIVVNVGVSGVHTIRIQEGDRYQGVCLTSVAIDGIAQPVSTITRRYAAIGDSVSMGCLSTPRKNGWALRMRDSSRFDSVVLTGKSAWAMLDAMFPGYNAAAAAILVRALLPPIAAYTGSTENVVALCLSINDFYNSLTTAATFGGWLATLADGVKTAADAQGTPGFKLMLHSMTHLTAGVSGPNPGGSTAADFNAAIAAVAAARPSFCTYVNLFSACTDADMVDGLHPNATGHGLTYAAVLAAT